jgi:hypothetical protein
MNGRNAVAAAAKEDAGFVEDVRLRRLACRALALQPAALPRSFVQPMREQ